MNVNFLTAWASSHPLMAGLAIYVVVEVLTILVTHKSITITLIAAFIDVMGKNSLGGFLIPKLAVLAVLVLAVLTVAMYWVITHPENPASATQTAASTGDTAGQIQLAVSSSNGAEAAAPASTPKSEPTAEAVGGWVTYTVQVDGLAVFDHIPSSNDPTMWDETHIVARLQKEETMRVKRVESHSLPGPNNPVEITMADFFVCEHDGREVFVFATMASDHTPTAIK